MWIGKRFVESLIQEGVLELVQRVEVDLYGSLALTGKGHATDKATVLGLAGFEPSTIDPDLADETFNEIMRSQWLNLNGQHSVRFDYEHDLVWNKQSELPHHPNGMTLRAYGEDTDDGPLELLFGTYYSVGGGFIKTEKQMLGENDEAVPQSAEDSQADSAASPPALVVPYFFSSATELLNLARKHKMSIADIMIANECAHRGMSEGEVFKALDDIAAAFDACVDRGLRVEGKMPVSNIPRRAAQIHQRLKQNAEKFLNDPLSVSDWIALYARAVNEENACGGRVVTAPTNGAAGTLPAVLTYYRRTIPTATTKGVRDFLATAAAIGSLCKRNASISGAEAGCQAEVGSACAMAAAGLAIVLGATSAQVENAAEIALEHCLGMTCDPIMGLVQIPCIERNCVAAIKAVTACRLALMGDGNHEVSLDSCIETMYRTGLDMQAKYRETSTGGLALFAKKMEPSCEKELF